MNAPRSMFTEAIEDHLALKKQNSPLETNMPLARYDVGDPLDRFPGGTNRGVDGALSEDAPVLTIDDPAAAVDPAMTMAMAGPSPEQAVATAMESELAGRPFEPLGGMTPMLSLVEDLEDEDGDETGQATMFAAADSVDAQAGADVLRFPGGVGPREQAAAAEPVLDEELDVEMTGSIATEDFGAARRVETPRVAADDEFEAPTGEQPVIVIDTEAPLAPMGFDEGPMRAAPEAGRIKRPRFFGLARRRKDHQDEPVDGWFTNGPRDFNWD